MIIYTTRKEEVVKLNFKVMTAAATLAAVAFAGCNLTTNTLNYDSSARSAISNERGTVSVTQMTDSNITVIYKSEKVNFARLYVSEGNGMGLVLANKDMTYSSGAYSYSFSHPTFTEGAKIRFCVLVSDDGEYCMPEGILSDVSSWKVVEYGKDFGVEEPSVAGIENGAIYTIVSKVSGKSLDVDNWSNVNGGNISQWSLGNSQENQLWKIESVGNDLYKIVSVHSGLCMDVSDVSFADGANVHQWEYVDGENQKWSFELLEDGTYKIINKNSGKVLDVSAASTADGANIQQYTWNETDAQRWILTKFNGETTVPSEPSVPSEPAQPVEPQNPVEPNQPANPADPVVKPVYSKYLDKETLVAKTSGLMTMQFKNTTNGKWSDDQIYITACALDEYNRWCYLTPNGNLNPIGGNETSEAWSFTLAQLKNGIQMPAMSSGRMYVSMGSPVILKGVVAADGRVGIVQPDLNNPNDVNQEKYFDWIEFTLSDVGFWGNTTQVDQFSFPIVMAMYNTDGYYRSVGVTESRDEIFAEFEKLGDNFDTLVQRPYRIIAPCKGDFRTGRRFGNYMDSYVNECWDYYLNGKNTAKISHPLGDFTGYSTADGQFVFYCTKTNNPNLAQVGKNYYVAAKPNNDELFEGSGVLASPSVGADGAQTTVELALQAWVCAALNRHVFMDPQNWNNPAAWFKGGEANWYADFWHKHNIDSVAYGFCYDDVFDQSSLIQTGNPRGLVIGIGW